MKSKGWEERVDKLFEEVYLYSEAGAVENAHVGVKKLIASELQKQKEEIVETIKKIDQLLAFHPLKIDDANPEFVKGYNSCVDAWEVWNLSAKQIVDDIIKKIGEL